MRTGEATGPSDQEAESGVRRPAGSHRAKLHPILALLVLCAVGLSPVEYRGGAEQPHAHAVFQLWVDAADGTLHHHGDGAHGGAPIVGVPAANLAAAAEAPPDTPRLGALASAERASLILAVAATSFLAAAGSIRVRAVWPLAVALSGRPVAPASPPPRPFVAFA